MFLYGTDLSTLQVNSGVWKSSLPDFYTNHSMLNKICLKRENFLTVSDDGCTTEE